MLNINTDIWQGCAAFHELFNTMIGYVMGQTIGQLPFRRKCSDRILADSNFTDDIALICTSAAELENALNKLSADALKVGLHISRQKTKIMIVDPKGSTANSPAFNISGRTVKSSSHLPTSGLSSWITT